jgi:hypothetical protein
MRSTVVWLLATLALLAACSGGTGPTAGTLSVSLITPHLDDGAVLLTISGGPVDSVEAAGHRVYSSQPDANTLRLILAGDLGSGTVARVHVPDTRQVARYTVLLSQVAARSTYAQRDPAHYTISLQP